MTKFEITPREAFIYLCFNMVSADRDVDDREIKKLFELIHRYGFDKDEIKHVLDIIHELGTTKAFERGVESIEIAKQLDDDMKAKLLHALLEIGEADQKVVDPELSFYTRVKTAFEK